MTRRVVITGIGVVAPGAATTETFWNNCMAGVAPVAPIPAHWSSYAAFSSTIWAPLPELDYSAHDISRVERMQLDPSSMLALIAARQALHNANISPTLVNEKKNTFALNGVDANRGGVFCGTGIGGLTSLIFNQANHIVSPLAGTLSAMENQLVGDADRMALLSVIKNARSGIRIPQRFNPFIVSMTMPNAVSANIGIKYSLRGPNTTVCCACAAGTVAIGHAFRTIRANLADFALCGGAEYLGDEFGGIFRGFDTARTLVNAGTDPATANRPFDARRSGFLFAEGGAAMLAVEELSHALSRGATPIAEITGFAETFDGYNIMIMDPSAEHMRRMLVTLLDSARTPFSEIDYINAHGTGTTLNDDIEARLIGDCFGSKPLVNSTKSLIGHTIGAGGAIEAAVTALSISRKATHACKNLDDPIADLNFVRRSGAFPISKSVTQSFAFGGHNAGLVLEEFRNRA
jgi:3-oxoacyl-[acyl-carrier-protein] synthase II